MTSKLDEETIRALPTLKSSVRATDSKRQNDLYAKKHRSTLTSTEQAELAVFEENDRAEVDHWQTISKPYFAEIKTFHDFTLYGLGVILNKLVPPWYYALYYTPGAGDNPNQLPEDVNNIANINALGFVTINGQPAVGKPSDEWYQKAWIEGFVQAETGEYLCKQLNKQEGVAAFRYRPAPDINELKKGAPLLLEDLYVTYDDQKPFTKIGNFNNTAIIIAEWNSSWAKTLLTDPDIWYLVVVDTMVRNTLTKLVADLLFAKLQRAIEKLPGHGSASSARSASTSNPTPISTIHLPLTFGLTE